MANRPQRTAKQHHNEEQMQTNNRTLIKTLNRNEYIQPVYINQPM